VLVIAPFRNHVADPLEMAFTVNRRVPLKYTPCFSIQNLLP